MWGWGNQPVVLCAEHPVRNRVIVHTAKLLPLVRRSGARQNELFPYEAAENVASFVSSCRQRKEDDLEPRTRFHGRSQKKYQVSSVYIFFCNDKSTSVIAVMNLPYAEISL